MNRPLKHVGLWLVLSATPPAYAIDRATTQVIETGTGASPAPDTTLSASELARARAWGLTAMEWQRYQHLLQGIRGSVSPATISPLEVLGIHARDRDERRRYAERWARTLHEDVDRILAFQRAYDDAGKRLYPNEPLIDIDRLPGKAEKSSPFQSSDRVLFFTGAECPACEVVLNTLLQRINELGGIDIYLTDVAPGDDEAVREWASRHTIDPQWVRSRRVTLNHDAGALAKLIDGEGKVPYLMRRRGEDLSKLSASDL
ncbi:MAG: TIGR03759 family integrating conjugative element protein [Pseudomonadota bacterium]|nr:TIGR03759 family integrating conjugative element protein [Pseudomonadota bacterium]